MSDKVWVAFHFGYSGEHSNFLGVFSSKEKVEDSLKNRFKEDLSNGTYVMDDSGDVVEVIRRNGITEAIIAQAFEAAMDKSTSVEV